MVEPNDGALTEGARLLAIAVQRFGSQGKVAREIGATSSLINRYLKGTRKPGRDICDQMRTRLGIPPAAWSQPAQDPGIDDEAPPESRDSTPERDRASGE